MTKVKDALRHFCFDYQRQYGAKIKVVRIFNTYGPNMQANDGRVVSNFIVQALKNEPITIYGDGSQTRSFCYVDDLIEAFIRMMESRNAFYGPVNIGNPVEFTMLELAEKILSLTKSDSEIVSCLCLRMILSKENQIFHWLGKNLIGSLKSSFLKGSIRQLVILKLNFRCRL